MVSNALSNLRRVPLLWNRAQAVALQELHVLECDRSTIRTRLNDHIEGLESISLEVFDTDWKQSFLESYDSSHRFGWMIAIVVDKQLVIDEQSATVIRDNHDAIKSIVLDRYVPRESNRKIAVPTHREFGDIEFLGRSTTDRFERLKVGHLIEFPFVKFVAKSRLGSFGLDRF